MWEYKRNEIEIDFFSISRIGEELNKFGNDNWEIIYYHEDKPEFVRNSKIIKITILMRKLTS